MAKTYIDSNGYRRFANSGKLVHRWVAAKKIGRPLRSKEVVHHGFGGKLDNRLNNLWVFKNNREHLKKKHVSLFRKIFGD
ncbi:HNH endonuclease [Candidatus Woesearchaeota archaeon]|nr:HNH endonuclease [Candidatus Woesearchaeota archaeon]